MKLSALSFLFAAVSIVTAAPATVSSRQEADVIVTYSGIPDQYIYSFGDCIPFRIDGSLADSAEVTRFAKCFGYSDGNCQYQDMPVPVVVPPGVNFLNAGDPAEVVGESAMCWELE